MGSLRDKLVEDHVIPDILDAFIPSTRVEIRFGDHRATHGNLLSPQVTKQPPIINYADPGTYSTLIMVDADYPTELNPAFREWRMWVVVNIPGNCVEKGDTLSAYAPPDPPQDSGIHRYVVTVFKQPHLLKLMPMDDNGNNRAYFNTRKFAAEHNLVPIGCNYFVCKNDDKSKLVSVDLARLAAVGYDSTDLSQGAAF